MGPLRRSDLDRSVCEIGQVTRDDFMSALAKTNPSVSDKTLKKIELWKEQFGSC